jgi:hypothetical protein
VAQPCPQVVEHLVCDVNPKPFHENCSFWRAHAADQ